MSQTNYKLKRGDYLTIEGTATDINGAAVDISSGYTFVVTIKRRFGQADESALVHKNSVDDASRFSVSSNVVTISVLLSSESNGANLGAYQYDTWAVETATGQETPIECGTITISDTATDTKA
jgi:hypothetical protein